MNLLGDKQSRPGVKKNIVSIQPLLINFIPSSGGARFIRNPKYKDRQKRENHSSTLNLNAPIKNTVKKCYLGRRSCNTVIQ